MKKFWNHYILLNLKDYVDIDFPITLFLLALTICIILAAFALYQKNKIIYKIIKKLIKHNAIRKEQALTLKELKLSKNRFVRWALAGTGKLSFLVKQIDETEYTYDDYRRNGLKSLPKTNFESAKFYLNEQSLPIAKQIFDGGEESILKPIFSSILLLLVFVFLAFLMPSFLTLLF